MTHSNDTDASSTTANPAWASRTAQDAGLSHSLDLLADTYNYNHWVYSLCRPWLGKVVMEVGAGTGNLTQFLLGAEKVVCVEPEQEYRDRLAALVRVHLNTTFYPLPLQGLPKEEAGYDSVLCVNVLEHIEDDQHALAEMAERLRPGGHVVLYVPAVSWAYGEMDRHLGHYRRYSRTMMRRLSAQCDLPLVRMKYVNVLGLFGWWWCGRVRREALIDPAKARFMDRLVPFVSAVEKILPTPVGQSLLAVFRKR